MQDLKDFFSSKTKEIGEEKIQASHLKEALESANTDGEKAIRAAGLDTKVWVGGAVLTQEYADMIGADKYCKDALSSVTYANEFFGN